MGATSTALHAAASTVASSLLPSSSTAKAQDTGASSSTGSTSTTSSATSTAGDITSNDFLTLLVTEMKNQDPTQPTDPNAYIQQLVGVNSLQQLIGIDQGISTLVSGVTGSGGSTGTTGTTGSTGTSGGTSVPGVSTTGTSFV